MCVCLSSFKNLISSIGIHSFFDCLLRFLLHSLYKVPKPPMPLHFHLNDFHEFRSTRFDNRFKRQWFRIEISVYFTITMSTLFHQQKHKTRIGNDGWGEFVGKYRVCIVRRVGGSGRRTRKRYLSYIHTANGIMIDVNASVIATFVTATSARNSYVKVIVQQINKSRWQAGK